MAVGDKIIVHAEFTVTGDTGADYGNDEVTPQFISDYLHGAGSVLVPGADLTDVTWHLTVSTD